MDCLTPPNFVCSNDGDGWIHHFAIPGLSDDMQNLHRSTVECIPKHQNKALKREIPHVILMHFCNSSPEIANIPTIFSGIHVKSLEISLEPDVVVALLDFEI